MAYISDFNDASALNQAHHSELRALVARTFANDEGILRSSASPLAMPNAQSKAAFEGWKQNQIDFAVRIAKISAAHAAKQAEAIARRNRRVSLARRVALLFMVIAINVPLYL